MHTKQNKEVSLFFEKWCPLLLARKRKKVGLSINFKNEDGVVYAEFTHHLTSLMSNPIRLVNY